MKQHSCKISQLINFIVVTLRVYISRLID